jgi:serine/threonine protein phosphatase PrpC
MIWKVIGQSVIGSSHVQTGKPCQDAVRYKLISWGDDEALLGFISDGAGSARYADIAADLAVENGLSVTEEWLRNGNELDEPRLLQLGEAIYDELTAVAAAYESPVNEFSCTLLGFIILPHRACFLQIGDGAIIRNDGKGHFTTIWWPHNGEYQNTTAFLIDDQNLPNLKTRIIEEEITEIAVFTDGLQMLALNNETITVHQPFFNDLFKWLRKADDARNISILNNKLREYLSGSVINSRTDDDKTLLLATKLKT